jgi:hypothetical protein
MSKITFGGAGGGGGSSGLSDMDWADPVDGNIAPDADSTRAIGARSLAFSSGVFDNVFLHGATTDPQSGVKLYYSAPQYLLVRNFGDTGYLDIVANEVRGGSYGVGLTGNIIRFRDTGDVHWSSTTSPTGTQDLTVSRKEAGVLQVGTTTTNALGHIKASGGIFTSGIVLAAPNGSGWQITVDNNGVLTATGPFLIG